MRCPKISIPDGSDVAIVELRGDKRSPEPESVEIRFPGGRVTVTRCSDGLSYWAHVAVNNPRLGDGTREMIADGVLEEGRAVGARLDITDKSTCDVSTGDFENPNLYHLAVQIERGPAAGGGVLPELGTAPPPERARKPRK